MRVKELAKRLGVTYGLAARLVRTKQILAINLGTGQSRRTYDISEEALAAFKTSRETQPVLPARSPGLPPSPFYKS
jgi:hypothetical protein